MICAADGAVSCMDLAKVCYMKLSLKLAAVCLAAAGAFGLSGCGKVQSIVLEAIQEDAFDQADKRRLEKMNSE